MWGWTGKKGRGGVPIERMDIAISGSLRSGYFAMLLRKRLEKEKRCRHVRRDIGEENEDKAGEAIDGVGLVADICQRRPKKCCRCVMRAARMREEADTSWYIMREVDASRLP